MSDGQLLRADDPRLSWHGAISLHRTDDWVMPWRVPYAERGLFPEPLLERAAAPAGVRLAFRSTTQTVTGRIIAHPDSLPLDVSCNGEVVQSVELAGCSDFTIANLPPGEKAIELWLPQFGEFRLRDLVIDSGVTIEPFDEPRPRWMTYGSSITQCRTAGRPTRTWPAIVARTCGYNLTCLGYGGQCHLDPMIARMMRDRPADYLSICAGINIYGAASLGPRAFRPAIIGFIEILRERHADVPFALLSPIFSPPRETTPNAVGFTLQAMREEVAAAVDALRAHGDDHITYIDGLSIFDASLAAHLPDDLHPDAEGYRRMAGHFVEKVAEPLFH